MIQNAKERLENKMFRIIDTILKEGPFNSLESIFPLVYTLRAFYEGHYLSILSRSKINIFKSTDKKVSLDFPEHESDMLKLIRNTVTEDFFIGFYANLIDRFFNLIIASFDFDSIRLVYSSAIDYIIQKAMERNGRMLEITTTPKEVARLMANLIDGYGCKNIYNPFSGLCTIALQDNVKERKFYCQEINKIIYTLAKVRIDAVKSVSDIHVADSIVEWKGMDSCFDCIAAEVPLHMRIEAKFMADGMPIRSDIYPFYAALDSQSARYGIYLVTSSVCTAPAYSKIRKAALERNIIEMVIELPSRLHTSTATSTCVVVFNLNKENNNVRLVNATECIKKVGQHRFFDVSAAMELIETKECNSMSQDIELKELVNNDSVIIPSRYAFRLPEIKEGDSLYEFNDIVTLDRGAMPLDKEFKGTVITLQDLHSDLVEAIVSPQKTKIENIQELSRYRLYTRKCVITTHTFKSFYIKTDDTPVLVPTFFEVFRQKNENVVSTPYLIYAIQQAEKYLSDDFGIQRNLLRYVHLVIPTREKQDIIIDKLCQERKVVLDKKRQNLSKMSVLNDSSSDLLHELGLTFTKIGAGIGLIKNDDYTDVTKALTANVNFALRMIECAGADFQGYEPYKEKVSLVETMLSYIKDWNAFGYKSFHLSPLKAKIPTSVKVDIDVKLFYIVLDCILANAHQHGFVKKAKEGNTVSLEINAVFIGEEPQKNMLMLRIGNNGIPFDDDLTIEKYAERGYVGSYSGHNGLGGDHISKIMHIFNGGISIEKAEGWSYVNLFLPIYVAFDELNIEPYNGVLY